MKVQYSWIMIPVRCVQDDWRQGKRRTRVCNFWIYFPIMTTYFTPSRINRVRTKIWPVMTVRNASIWSAWISCSRIFSLYWIKSSGINLVKLLEEFWSTIKRQLKKGGAGVHEARFVLQLTGLQFEVSSRTAHIECQYGGNGEQQSSQIKTKRSIDGTKHGIKFARVYDKSRCEKPSEPRYLEPSVLRGYISEFNAFSKSNIWTEGLGISRTLRHSWAKNPDRSELPTERVTYPLKSRLCSQLLTGKLLVEILRNPIKGVLVERSLKLTSREWCLSKNWLFRHTVYLIENWMLHLRRVAQKVCYMQLCEQGWLNLVRTERCFSRWT